MHPLQNTKNPDHKVNAQAIPSKHPPFSRLGAIWFHLQRPSGSFPVFVWRKPAQPLLHMYRPRIRLFDGHKGLQPRIFSFPPTPLTPPPPAASPHGHGETCESSVALGQFPPSRIHATPTQRTQIIPRTAQISKRLGKMVLTIEVGHLSEVGHNITISRLTVHRRIHLADSPQKTCPMRIFASWQGESLFCLLRFQLPITCHVTKLGLFGAVWCKVGWHH